MTYLCKNAQEEFLKEMAIPMKVRNELDTWRELLECGGIDEKTYIDNLRRLLKIAHD